MKGVLNIIINTIVGSLVLILVMFILSSLMIGLDNIRIKLMNIFYNTKIGSIFKKYKLFECFFLGLSFLLLLIGCFEMARQMIGVYF